MTTRHIVCPVRNSSRFHLYHIVISTLDTSSFVHVSKLNIYAIFIPD